MVRKTVVMLLVIVLTANLSAKNKNKERGDTMNKREALFSHLVLEGSDYEVGNYAGNIIKNIPEMANYFKSGTGALTDEAYSQVCKMFDTFSPGLNDEIKGFADALKMEPKDIIYHISSIFKKPNCSLVSVIPKDSGSGDILMGRNYDMSDLISDKMLITTKIPGKYNHIGFSSILFGRLDGMNEHGLAVAMASAGMPVGIHENMKPPVDDGFQYWVLIRMILEQCKNVEEAITLTEKVPLGTNINLMLTDKTGKSVVIEISGKNRNIIEANKTQGNKYTVATNHFQSDSMKKYVPEVLKSSLKRFNLIEDFIANGEKSEEGVKGLLSKGYPNGLCCHYYDGFFGTIHSMVFNVTKGYINICFASPNVNKWYKFDLETNSGMYPAIFPLEITPKDFYSF